MKRILAVLCAVSGLVAAGDARAQTAPSNPTWVFTAIDAVARQYDTTLYLTGVLEGAAGPSTFLLRSYVSSAVGITGIDGCERYAITLMTKPGQYRLEAWAGSSMAATYCRLVKLNP